MTTPPGALSAALTDLWAAIRERHTDLPGARVVVMPGRTPSSHGPDRWALTDKGLLTGLTMPTDVLREGPSAALRHLLHEAAHVLCWLGGESDTSQRGQYHNGRFLAAAEAVGLTWSGAGPDGTGYAGVTLPTDTARLYVDILRPMGPVIDAVLPFVDVQQPRASTQQRLSIACQCTPPRLARMSQTQIERGPITCGVCGAEFQPAS